MALLAVSLVASTVPLAGSDAGYVRLLPILSGSMAPEFPTGSLVIATPVPLTSIRTGEVIVYREPVGAQRLIAHRIVRVVSSGAHPIVLTKGDANAAADPWSAHLEGRQVWVVRTGIPFLGYATVYAKRALAALLVLLAVTAVTGGLLRRIWRQPNKRHTESRDEHPSLAR
jgi:signal peptidase I